MIRVEFRPETEELAGYVIGKLRSHGYESEYSELESDPEPTVNIGISSSADISDEQWQSAIELFQNALFECGATNA